ncbi:ABC transporter permease subunit [Corynebacterium sp. DSM 45110]|uniref:ABC transporter permease subunit n=2 Tax=Corynebacterium suicordis TaxID=203264 RepID=A0ABR9ZIJ5_9CORY|nr:ABC transporter permease subunit [Corynebacterium suicordis DSM 45110]
MPTAPAGLPDSKVLADSRVRAGRNFGVPRRLLVFALCGIFMLIGPLVGLLVSIPWLRLPELAGSAEARSALQLSLVTSATSTLICALLGIPLALWLRRWERRSATLAGMVQMVVYAPLVLSPVVSGLALTFLWGRRGLLGQWLDGVGVNVAYSMLGVVVVQVFVSLPFFVAMVAAALHAIPHDLEEAATLDGANRMQVMRHILLPLALPGVVTGMVLSFARALSEYGATLTFAGNVEGQTRTIPLLVSLGLSSGDMDQALGACILLLGVYVLIGALIVAVRMVSGVRR